MPARFPAVPALLLLLTTALAACSGAAVIATDPTPGVAAGSGGTSLPTSSAGGGTLVDLDVEVCTFLDLATVQELTGVSESFATQGTSQPSGSSCFWGATKPGVPGYVEVRIFRQTSLANYSYGQGCTVMPVVGVADEAAFVECPANPQVKTSMLAFERGVIASVLVNEPATPLTAGDLSPVIESVFGQLP